MRKASIELGINASTFYSWIEENQELRLVLDAAFLKSKELPKGVDYYRLNCARETNKKRFPNSSIYILNIEGSNYYKIGVSQNVKRRVSDISSAMPFKVVVLYNQKEDKAYDKEEYLHQLFAERYVKSEWFNLTDDDVYLLMSNLKPIEKWEDPNIGKVA